MPNLDSKRHFTGCQIERMTFLPHETTGDFNSRLIIQLADEVFLDHAVKMDGRQMTQPCAKELHVTYAETMLKELMLGNGHRGFEKAGGGSDFSSAMTKRHAGLKKMSIGAAVK